ENYLSGIQADAGDFFVGPFTCRVGPMVAEGDRVSVMAESIAEMRNGHWKNGFYHMLFEFRDGKIVRICELVDTLHEYRLKTTPPGEIVPSRVNRMFAAPSHVFEGDVRKWSAATPG